MSDEQFSRHHHIRQEDRPARCGNHHRERWAVCSCGWAYNSGVDGSHGSIGSAIVGHRLRQIEMALNINVTFK